MPAQWIDGKLVANVSARERQIDTALQHVAPLLGKQPQELTLEEVKTLVYFLLARLNILDEVNAAAPPPTEKHFWCWLPLLFKRSRP